ncbi:MAG: Ig-like domain-containing protein [Myxococcota bacterium]|nr:Ig-like domain-containing protein [Myxococcota bacterium]
MTRRYVDRRKLLGRCRRVLVMLVMLVSVLGLGGLGGCYDLPKPDCGFRCGPSAACPDDYTCASDGRCHRNGAPPSLVCAPADAAVDTPIDAYSPSVVQITPADEMPGVDVTTSVTARFDVDVTGVASDTFVLIDSEGELVDSMVSYDPGTFTATLIPAEPLLAGRGYEAALSSAITNASGTPLRELFWSFTTAAATPPP